MHHTEPNLECPVGKGIRPALGQVYGKIEQALRHELAFVSVADVLRETLQVPEVTHERDSCAAFAVGPRTVLSRKAC
jgi:hypothetical protein